MNFNISNIQILNNKEDRLFLEEHLNEFIANIRYIPLKYRKSDVVEIDLAKKNDAYNISLSYSLSTGVINLSGTGNIFKSLVTDTFEKFASKVNAEVEKIRKEYSVSKKNSYIESVNLSDEQLKNLGEKGKIELFRSLISSTLPDIIGYIKRRVHSAKMSDIKVFNNVFVKDVVSEVILQIHGRFQENINNVKEFNIWSIQESDKVLNDILENSSLPLGDISYEQLVDHELSELEEEYTTDAGGDFVMNDEVDDFISDHNYNDEVFSHYLKNKEQVEEAEQSDEEMNDKIFDELIKLPIKYQSIYDLYYFELVEIDEIAAIKSMQSIEIEAILISIKELLSEKV
jgi:hypothetical protein